MLHVWEAAGPQWLEGAWLGPIMTVPEDHMAVPRPCDCAKITWQPRPCDCAKTTWLCQDHVTVQSPAIWLCQDHVTVSSPCDCAKTMWLRWDHVTAKPTRLCQDHVTVPRPCVAVIWLGTRQIWLKPGFRKMAKGFAWRLSRQLEATYQIFMAAVVLKCWHAMWG